MKPATQKIIKVSFLLSTFYFLLSNKPTQAQVSTGLSAIPPRLEITAKPGQVVTQQIKVRNESPTEKIISTSANDIIVNNNSGSIIEVKPNKEDNRWAAASWIQISPTSLKLKPGETKSLSVTIIAPENALPGGHYAKIVHSPNNDLVLSQTGTSVEIQVGTLIYITIPGDIKEDAIVTNFTAPKFSEFGPIDFKAIIKNESDIHILPVGSIIIKNWFGGKTAQLKLDDTNIFPYTSRTFEKTLEKKWLFGRYQANLNTIYGTTGIPLIATTYFWVIPWRLLILITAAIVIVATLVIIFKNQPPKKPTNSLDEVTELEKEIETLKKKYKDQ